MKMLTDFLPVLLFFILYKIAGLYAATWAAIIAAVGQFLFYKIVYKRVEPMVCITMVLIIILGGSTLIFHNELFIKWKPTAIDWAFSLAFFGSLLSHKPLTQRMLEHTLRLPTRIWRTLSIGWAGFFLMMGGVNIYVAYHYSTDTWVNFKVFGMLGITVVFVLLQSVYIARHIEPEA